MLPIPVIDQGIEVLGGDKDDVTALAAITAVRAAELDKLLPAKAHCAAAAVTALQVDLALVEELHLKAIKKGNSWAAPPLAPVCFVERLFGSFCRGRLGRHDRDIGPSGQPGVKLDRALRSRKQSVVTADSDMRAGMEFGAALSHDD